ncbi:LytTR family DNA-binding domain-containing protein [Williamsia sp. CHRR-6]|uniref:LytR/AlgR family response regulator transcription factor n=1 Tax=Williamsia sp. CHRR-6 TaxID=2835871 RepID=UPI001BDAC513|nr:LytTR family DNA-binding domain-containing protein [Williamsia sp. CHRR-6]MBT0566600.1 response regulator transcription factor [Williamsia sp. CHRR-6]
MSSVTQVSDSRADGAHRGLTVLAVDDELPALDELRYALREQHAITDVLTAADATTALRLITDRADIDAVFLDINMPGLSGLELAGVLAAFADPPAIVFVTAHDDRAVAAFELGAVDYLLKPLRAERVTQAVARVAARAGTGDRRDRAAAETPDDEIIAVEVGGVTSLVPRSSVAWVEAEGDYARLHTATGSHLVRIPLSTLESRWAPAGFIRIHRSFLVAMALVTGIRSRGSGTVVCLAVGGQPVELPVSRRHTRDLKDRLVGGSPGSRR